MRVRVFVQRWKYLTLLCIALLALSHCGSNEVELPLVTEESLTPEQKAQYDRMRNIQADVLRRAGMEGQEALTPEEVAQRRFEEAHGYSAGQSANETAGAE